MRRTPRTRSILFVAMFCLAMALFLPTVYAANPAPSAAAAKAVSPIPARVTQAIDETQLVRLDRNTRPEANVKNDRGAVSDGFNADHMFLLLQRSPALERKLDKLIDQMNDKKSANFHHWLTAEEFGQKFGVAQADIDQVTNWLQSHGFQINRVYPSRVLIDFSGTAGQVREAFRTEIHQLDVNGEMHFSNMSDPQIPAALAPVVKGIASLNDFKPEPMYRSAKDYTYAGCTTSSTNTEPGSCYAVTPLDNQTIYGLNPLYSAGISGQGQTIVLVEDTDTYGGAADWNTYRSTFGLASSYPQGSYSQVHPGGCTDPGTNADDGEAAIDVEVATAIAPSAAIELISCPSGTFTFGGQIALQNLINASSTPPSIVSVSYGICEALNGTGGNAAFYNTYQQAAAEGVSVFVSSGDAGASGCSRNFSVGSEYDVTSLGVSGWGETPYNVSVGGTDFEDTYNAKEGGPALSTYWSATNSTYYGSALSYIPEIPWNDACASALISEYLTGSFTPYGASPATCNNSSYDTSTTFLSTGAASGGPSNCATGAAGANQSSYLITQPQCQGYAKPSWQSAYGVPADGVRDTPDVSMFAANGVFGHFETVCWSDPAYTADGSAVCTGAPSTWSGFGGTSVASPTMAAIQALVNQKTGESWGNPNPIYYQIAQSEYGTAGGSFLGASCNSSGTGGPGSGCVFNDVTQGDIDVACEDNGTTEEAHCYKPTGTYGVDSTDNVTAATIISGGTGYTTAPTCTIAGPSNNSPYKSPTGTTLFTGGTQAACTATVSSASTTGVWTVKISTAPGSTTTGVWPSGSLGVTVGATTYTFVTSLTGTTIPNAVLVVASGTPSAQETGTAKNLEAAINNNSTQCSASPCFANVTAANASATATESTSTDTLTAKTAGYAGAFNVAWITGFNYGPDYIVITNTVLSQGPNYVNAIAITTAGSGYQPETPITLTGGGGSGAIAVANTTPGTASQSYQPAYGAAPGYDLATGLGTVNAANLVNSCAWFTATPGISSPTASSTLTGSSATFKWNGYCGATAYWLDVGAELGGHEYYSSGSLPTSTLSASVTGLPINGSTVYARWYYLLSGTWQSIDTTYTAFGGSSNKGAITSPTPSSTLSGSSVTFVWSTGSGATSYWIDAGSTAGGHDYYSSGSLGNVTSTTVNGLPTNGSTVYITLYSLVSGSWLSNAYTFTAYNLSAAGAVMQTPTPGSTVTSGTVTFTWAAGSGSTAYWLDVGSTSGGHDFYSSGNLGSSLTTTVSGLPTDGSTFYATLYSLIGGTWSGVTYTYYALNSNSGLATIQTPMPSTVLSGSTATFTWSTDANATAYWMDIGSAPNGNTIYSSGNLGNVQTTTVYSLPADGSTIYVTLYSYVGGQWLSTSASYTSGP